MSVPAGGRGTAAIPGTGDVALALTSTRPVVAERVLYFDAEVAGLPVDGGTAAVGLPG
jgi:hypothetical protein